MATLKGSETEKNLLKSFAGESQARNRYTYFSKQAKKEGYEQIAFVFEETANHEKEHAKRFFSLLEGGELEITAAFPAGKVGTTLENLKASAGGELEEHSSMYPEFAEIADKEGFKEIAVLFRAVCVAEAYHENRFRGLASKLENGMVFKSEKEVVWRCRNCGYVHTGTTPPNLCPACKHPQAHYEELREEW